MKTILVPTDYSAASRSAALYAASLARHFNSRLVLVNAVEPPLLADDQVLASVLITQAEIVQQHIDLMKEEVSAVSSVHPVLIDSYVREDYTVSLIGDVADKTDADLIVMGMKGKGKSNSVFGSTTTAVVRKLEYPVFVIPEKVSFHAITDIVVASDYNPETATGGYGLLKVLAGKFNSKIKVLNVTRKPAEMTPSEKIGQMKTSSVFLEYPTEFHGVTGKDVEEGIERFLENNPHDILVMVARGHSFFERLFGKVHTKQMSYRTKKPLLILQDK